MVNASLSNLVWISEEGGRGGRGGGGGGRGAQVDLRLDNTSQGLHHATLVFFCNISYDIGNIYFKLISLNSQMKILSNDTNTMWQQNRRIYVELAETKKTFLTIILCVSITFSIFNKSNDIFRSNTKGLNAGKGVSDFLFISEFKFYKKCDQTWDLVT